MLERRDDSCIAREMRGDAYSQCVGLLPHHPGRIGIVHSSSLDYLFIPILVGEEVSIIP